MVRAVPVLLLLVAACGGSAPVTIEVVEEHHEAWAKWEEARAAGRLPAGATLVHLDAHEDFGVPDELPLLAAPDQAAAAARAARDLSVSDFIVPAILAGTVGEYVWVVPPWLEGAELRDVEGRIAARGDEVRYRHRVVGLDDLPAPERAWILDVDLDFFACENPHAGHQDEEISQEEFERLLFAGEVRRRGSAEEGDRKTESIWLRRPPGPFRWPIRLDRVESRRTGVVRWVRGFVCMGEYEGELPVHRPSDKELRALVWRVRERLSRLPVPPSAITVSRSATSGFVPADRVDGIEGEVRRALRGIWPVRE